jgi:hypothetical protein
MNTPLQAKPVRGRDGRNVHRIRRESRATVWLGELPQRTSNRRAASAYACRGHAWSRQAQRAARRARRPIRQGLFGGCSGRQAERRQGWAQPTPRRASEVRSAGPARRRQSNAVRDRWKPEGVRRRRCLDAMHDSATRPRAGGRSGRLHEITARRNQLETR